MPLNWFGSGEARAFARELAQFVVGELAGATGKRDAKFTARAEKVRVAAARRLQDFKQAHRLNFFSRSTLANEFLWALKDGGCPPDYADELTEWLTLRL
jgi:hypothetical protein